MKTVFDFRQRSVLVVGGSSGIGNGIAQAFRAAGADVQVWGTRASAADYAGEEGSNLEGLSYTQVNLAQPGAVETAPAPATLDVLVQAQGTVLYRRGEFEMDGFRKVIEVNLNSVMACAMKFRPLLAASQGSMIVLGSLASFRSAFGNPGYSATKSGVLGLVRSLGEGLIREGVRVNGIAPGFVETKMTAVTMENPKRRDAALAAIPAGRFGSADDMAGAALFLASPLASYIVGQMLVVDGGMSLSV
ncbi:SDR family NAD(P)-dependent oxidoreductase [Panacagrimonas sp.]|uniref:SDR family NAD(P)-dependent oxidoreductase n=1 Tax=Panacagrimonas sp. TaxID=2480088 RepID=UPI003B52DEC1